MKAVRDIKKGDTFVDENGVEIWTAIKDAQMPGFGVVVIDVQFKIDGGCSSRSWNNFKHEINIIEA